MKRFFLKIYINSFLELYEKKNETHYIILLCLCFFDDLVL
jgi:hypothetical protein